MDRCAFLQMLGVSSVAALVPGHALSEIVRDLRENEDIQYQAESATESAPVRIVGLVEGATVLLYYGEGGVAKQENIILLATTEEPGDIEVQTEVGRPITARIRKPGFLPFEVQGDLRSSGPLILQAIFVQDQVYQLNDAISSEV